mgnify:CR=1
MITDVHVTTLILIPFFWLQKILELKQSNNFEQFCGDYFGPSISKGLYALVVQLISELHPESTGLQPRFCSALRIYVTLLKLFLSAGSIGYLAGW